jgi:hypothetical protein
VDARTKQRIEEEIDRKIESLKGKRLREFECLVKTEKEKLERVFEKDRKGLRAEAENRLTGLDAKQKGDFNKLVNRYKTIKGRLEKTLVREKSRMRALQRDQKTRNRFLEEQATRKLDFRDNEHEFFKLKHIDYNVPGFFNPKRCPIKEASLDLALEKTMAANHVQDAIKKNFYSVHVGHEEPNTLDQD